MKLIYKIALRLSLFLLPLLTLWAVIFYFTMVREINDEADDALEDYSELIIMRMLAGQPLPKMNEGSNNSYSITGVSPEYAAAHPAFSYHDAEVYIPEKEETEPARVFTTIFRDHYGAFHELQVAMPTFEKDDLQLTMLRWLVSLYLLLLVITVGTTLWVFHKSMRPLYTLLGWLDSYVPGRKAAPVPNDTDIREFRRLNESAQQAVDRSEQLFEQQKQFIGNASHELQTPLAVLQGRLEYLVDIAGLSEETMLELSKMQGTLSQAIRLNKTLLLLTRIDNGQFPESSDVDIAAMLRELQQMYADIYSEKQLRFSLDIAGSFTQKMNESLASVLLSNLLKNACIHSRDAAQVSISLRDGLLEVANDGDAPLDATRIFERFYQGSKKEGSTGLGLALVRAVAGYYGMDLSYGFSGGMHRFRVRFSQP